MKTSNKILLTFFVAVLVLITTVHMIVYAKYKKGDYVPLVQVRDRGYFQQQLPAVKYVSITGFDYFEIVPAEEYKLQLLSKRRERAVWYIKNDSLVLNADSLLTRGDYEKERRSYPPMRLYLPPNVIFNCDHSNITVSGSADSTARYSFIVATATHSYIATGDGPDKQYFDSVQINVRNASEVNIRGNAVLNYLGIESVASTINTGRFGFKNFSLSVDSASTITMLGKNVKNINVKDQ